MYIDVPELAAPELGCYDLPGRAAPDPGSRKVTSQEATSPRLSAARDRQAIGWHIEIRRNWPDCASAGQPGQLRAGYHEAELGLTADEDHLDLAD